MSYTEKYNEEQWQLISSLPTMIGLTVTGAGSSGLIGTAKEAMASVKSIIDAANAYPNNELIKAIAGADPTSAMNNAKTTQKVVIERMKASGISKPSDLSTLALADVETVNDLLCANELEEDVIEYQTWLKSIALKVAEAAKEGGFLGFGGTRISEGEAEFLDQLNGLLDKAEI